MRPPPLHASRLLLTLSLLATAATTACSDDDARAPDAGRPIDAPMSATDAPSPSDGTVSTPDAGSSDSSPPTDGGSGGATQVRVHYDVGFGNRVTLRGDAGGLTWDAGRDCTWTDGNVWLCDVDASAATVEVKPLFNDETWAKGSNWRVAPGATLDIYPFFFASSGRVVTHSAFASTILGNARDLFVYLPPSYDENAAKSYPIVLMHDGQNLFEPALSFSGVAWEIDAAIDTLAGSSGIVEPIVVGVANTPARIDEYTPTRDASFGGGNADAYLRFLTDEVLPFIRTTYRTSGDRVGLAGSSLGGLVSLHGCWTRPDRFDRCGVLSPSLWWDERELLTRIQSDTATAADKPITIYLDSGDSGSSADGMADTIAMRDILVAKGFVLGETLDYVLGVGDMHTESAWAARAPGALRFLLQDPDRAR